MLITRVLSPVGKTPTYVKNLNYTPTICAKAGLKMLSCLKVNVGGALMGHFCMYKKTHNWLPLWCQQCISLLFPKNQAPPFSPKACLLRTTWKTTSLNNNKILWNKSFCLCVCENLTAAAIKLLNRFNKILYTNLLVQNLGQFRWWVKSR